MLELMRDLRTIRLVREEVRVTIKQRQNGIRTLELLKARSEEAAEISWE